jgi:hypothetical protein
VDSNAHTLWPTARQPGTAQHSKGGLAVHISASLQVVDQDMFSFVILTFSVLFFWVQSWRSPLTVSLEVTLGIKVQSCPVLRLSHEHLWWRTLHLVRVSQLFSLSYQFIVFLPQTKVSLLTV